MKRLARRVWRTYRDSALKWRFVDNLSPTLAYYRSKPALSAEEGRVLRDLNQLGIAITTSQALLGAESLYPELRAAVETLENERREDLAKARALAETVADHKTFLLQLLGDRPTLEPDSVWVRFALQPPVLRVANTYYRMLIHMRFFNVWHTFATQAAPRRSQLWHRDPEDRMILKMFVYLNDIDQGAGPFVYAPGTHPKGSNHSTPESFRENGRQALRSQDEAMSMVVPADQWITATGKASTIIFADTRGYHKGGLARTSDRIMYNCLFVSPASPSSEVFARGESVPGLPRAQAFALRMS